jgi:hypothetical protein
LTYSVHAASTVLAVATMRSRRNLLDEIDASTLRLVRSRTRRTGARRVGSCDGPAGRHVAFRSTPCDETSRRQRLCPLTGGRHGRRAHGSGDESMWACHNEREEDQRGSPRESRVTVSPCLEAVNKGSGRVQPGAKLERRQAHVVSACCHSDRSPSGPAEANR